MAAPREGSLGVLTTKGDVLGVTSSGDVERLAVGEQEQRIIADPAETTGLKYNYAPDAQWTGTRYYALDYDGGSDANLGYSDVSLAAAGVVALKTWERLLEKLPRFGKGATLVIALKVRAGGAAYRNVADTADADMNLDGFYGYEQITVRATGDVTTAGAVAFADTDADKIALGAQLLAGTNAGGYNPIAPLAARSFGVQLAGGGAPGLAAEPGLLGYRIRFDSATDTPALRNVCRTIAANGTADMKLGQNLPATPTASDVFYIEQPALAFGRAAFNNCQFTRLSTGLNPVSGFAARGLDVAGLRLTNTGVSLTGKSIAGLINFAFFDSPAAGFTGAYFFSGSAAGLFTVGPTYFNADTVSRHVGGFRSIGGGTVSEFYRVNISKMFNTTGRCQITSDYLVQAGSACYFGSGLLVQNCGGAGGSVGSVGGIVEVGTKTLTGGSAQEPMRMKGGFLNESLTLAGVNAWVRGIFFDAIGNNGCIKVEGIGQHVVINDCTGSAGNTRNGLNLTDARDSHLLMGNLGANTFSGTLGDIQAQAGGRYAHVDLTLTDVRDNGGNHLQGTAGTIIGSVPLLATNNGVANIGQYKVCRGTASGLVEAAIATAASTATAHGVSQNSSFTTTQVGNLVDNGATWVEFDGDAPAVVPGIAYLSHLVAGNARSAAPPAAATNQKLRLGRIARVSGTKGLVIWFPETLPVLSDGLP